jgi:hypothetical protein
MGISVAAVNEAWSAISVPWSWVIDRRRWSGSRRTASASFMATRPAVRS